MPQGILDRLREQAELEGVSVSEWVRIALADRASLKTPNEMVATRARLAELAESPEEFDRYYDARLHRRRA